MAIDGMHMTNLESESRNFNEKFEQVLNSNFNLICNHVGTAGNLLNAGIKHYFRMINYCL